MRKSLFVVKASGGRGTALLIQQHTSERPALLFTAAHVVSGCGDIQIALDGTADYVPAEVLVLSRPSPNGPDPAGYDPDLALIRAKSIPDEAREAQTTHRAYRPTPCPPSGTEVLYGGYPLDEGADGIYPSMFAKGMVAACVEPSSGWPGRKQVIDGSINKGMSGGPVFCPGTGLVVGIITGFRLDLDPCTHHGHGWGLATPAYIAMNMIRLVGGDRDTTGHQPGG